MKNFVQKGDMVTVVAPAGGVTSGDGVLIGTLFGVAVRDAAAGENVDIAVSGVFDLPKVAAQTHAVGEAVGWDPATDEVNDTIAGAVIEIGKVLVAAGAATTSVRVRLNG